MSTVKASSCLIKKVHAIWCATLTNSNLSVTVCQGRSYPLVITYEMVSRTNSFEAASRFEAVSNPQKRTRAVMLWLGIPAWDSNPNSQRERPKL